MTFSIAAAEPERGAVGVAIASVFPAVGAVCPYVKAFPDREEYERWADGVPAATVAMPLMEAVDLAGKFVSDPE